MPRRQRKHWTVLATKQPNSADARKHIRRQGFEVAHLMYRKRPKHRVRKIMPLFPYYLLVRINPSDDRWKDLNSTRGVRKVFQNGNGKPTYIADEHVKKFRDIENEMGYVVVPEHEAPRFNANEIVEVCEGWLKGCQGIYKGLAGASHERVRVLFNILGIAKMLELNAFDLSADFSIAA